ncbi:head GIN domain-containing protein [Sphingomonas sp. ASY06-1R]|uniref:head GIN domain-containing protein n=1 Tax=Sphingomonas sp. ASY06-1R TaxID=3445771 RepID=UPI003FA31BF5
MRRLFLSALLAATAVTPAAAAERSFPTGGGFDRITNSTPFDVFVHTGRAPSVHVIGGDETLKRLQIDNRGGELRIGTKSGSWFSGWRWTSNERVRIDVNVPALVSARVSGPGNVSVDTVRVRDFGAHVSGPGSVKVATAEVNGATLDLSGPGNISIAGRASRAVINVSGPGNIRAQQLRVGQANVTVSGPGDVDATVTDTADIRLSGPGDVRIRGGARCAIHKSGPGSVDCD